jgi:hypothetical protein
MTDPIYIREYHPKNRILRKTVTVLKKITTRETQHGISSETRYLVECPHGMLSKLYATRSHAVNAVSHPWEFCQKCMDEYQENENRITELKYWQTRASNDEIVIIKAIDLINKGFYEDAEQLMVLHMEDDNK